tara:strand:+ start:740 stop:2740 length:2001 start_codon:yes stop_codon:yes gene_type:complete
MNTDKLKNIFEINNLSTGSIQAIYNFESGSGCLLFNDLYPTGTQVYTGDVNSPIIETSPAISISCSSHVMDNLSSTSGVFTGSDVLEIIKPISTGNWTFFVDYNKPESNHGNCAHVIVSTANDYTGVSGFNFGVNGSNRPYFEYIDSTNNRRIYTHSKEVGINNLISVSQNEQTLLITNHDIGSFQHESDQFEISNFVESDTLYIGNFPTGTNPGYSGFSGSMDSFVLYNEALAGNIQNTIAEDYFYSGIQSGYVEQSLVSGLEVTGVDVNLSGLTGTGITGSVSALYKTVETCLCGDINFYRDSGVSGELFGEVVTYLTGSGYITGLDFTDIPPNRLHDYSKTLKYAEQGITFLEKVPSGSIVELYSFTTFHPEELNLVSSYEGGLDYFTTATGYSGGNINVFGNGLAQYSGTQFTLIEDQLGGKNINFINNNFSGSDTVVFDRISGDQTSLYTFSGFEVTGLGLLASGSGYTSTPDVVFAGGENTAASALTGDVGGTTQVTGLVLVSGGSGHVVAPTVSITGGGAILDATGEAFINQNNYVISTTEINDPYLAGYKLLSGLDYTQTASQITLISSEIQNSQYTTGNIIFLPRISSNFVKFTGTADQFINTHTALVEEQVWLNRKRVILNENYIKVSNIGLMKSPVFVTGFNNVIYNNDNNFFNT